MLVPLWAPANVGEWHCLVCPKRLVASQECVTKERVEGVVVAITVSISSFFKRSMVSSCKKRRFQDPQNVETSIENVSNVMTLITRCENSLSLRRLEDWQSRQGNEAVNESNSFSLDLLNLQSLLA